MPTGYTAKVQSGEVTSLKQFFFLCAHAFTSYDQPMDAEIPLKVDTKDIESYEYNINCSLEKIEELANLSSMEANNRSTIAYLSALDQWKISKKIRVIQKEYYEQMLEKVKNWHPNPEIIQIKDFMIKQLEESMEFDCSSDLEKWYPEPKQLTGMDWVLKEIEKEKDSIFYNSKNLAKTKKINAESNKFLKIIHEELTKL